MSSKKLAQQPIESESDSNDEVEEQDDEEKEAKEVVASITFEQQLKYRKVGIPSQQWKKTDGEEEPKKPKKKKKDKPKDAYVELFHGLYKCHVSHLLHVET